MQRGERQHHRLPRPADCGRVVGPNFLSEWDAVRGVGPITIDPELQARGLGRRLMEAVIEQNHRAIRRRWRAMQCFRSFHTAERTLEGVEALHMMRKEQVKRLDGRDSVG